MNVDLLKTWLKLPPGSWPPDHYTLLGYQLGEGETDDIELHVLERMDLLRRFQLAHPELVTEGMNRLAQAQICLTNPESRAEYDRSLGLAPRPKVVKAPPPVPPKLAPKPPPPRPEPVADLPPGVKVVDYLPPGVKVVDYTPDEEPLILELDDQPIVAELVESYEFEADPPPSVEVPAVAPLELDPLEARELRRNVYRQIARIRRVLRVWDKLRPYVADPSHPLSRRLDAIALTATLSELKPLLPTVVEIVGEADKPGKLVAALARQQLAAQTFRGFLPGQRQALAEDWLAARRTLIRLRDQFRTEANRMIVKPWANRVAYPVLRTMNRLPELVLLALGGFALFVAMIRSTGG